MSTEPSPFDLNHLSRMIDQARSDRDMTWTQLSREVGVATSTIRRFETADDAEADGVLALIGWLDVPPETFVVDSRVEGVPLPTKRDGYIRIDMSLIAELPAWPRSSRIGTRTTIQRLVKAAQESGRTVTSLTLRSAI